MANIGYATLSVIPSAAGFSSALSRDITPGLSGVGRTAGKVLGAGLLIGAAVVVAGIGAIIKTGVGEAMDASAGTAQLAAGIKSTGNAAGVSVDKLNALASSIQGYSGQTDDSIVQSEALLLTFTNIKNGVGEGSDIFDRATVATANMAARMGGDASSSAIQLGKALNDPVKGVASLTRMGVQFTAAQKDTIAALVESGDVMGAQKVILAELETQFGGAAAAAGESLPGKLAIARRSFEDVSQSVAEGLLPLVLPGLTSIGATITTKVIPAITGFIQGFKDGTGAGGTFRDVLDKVGSVLGAVGGFITGTVVPSVQSFVTEFQNGEGAGGTFRDILETIGDVIGNVAGFITGAIVPAIGSFVQGFQDGEGAGGVFRDILTGIGDVIGNVAEFITGTIVPAIQSFVAEFQNGEGAGGTFRDILTGIGDVLNWLWTSVISPVASAIGAILTWLWNSVLSPVINFIVGAIRVWADVVSWLWTNILSPYFTAIGAIVGWLWTSIISPVVGFIVGAIRVWIDIVGWLWSNIISPIFSAIGAIFSWVWNNIISPIVGFIVGGINVLGAIFTWLWNNAISPAINFITGAFDNVKTAFGLVHDFFSDKVTAIGNIFSGIGDTISGAFKGVFNGIANAWNNSVGKLSWTVPGWVPVIGGDTISAPRIPLLASGALVTNPALAMLGESGDEAVLPFSRVDEFAGMVARQLAGMNLGKPDGRQGAGNLIDYDRLAAAMSRVNLTMDGRRVSESADAWIGARIR